MLMPVNSASTEAGSSAAKARRPVLRLSAQPVALDATG
jgi:hypothetical protein